MEPARGAPPEWAGSETGLAIAVGVDALPPTADARGTRSLQPAHPGGRDQRRGAGAHNGHIVMDRNECA